MLGSLLLSRQLRCLQGDLIHQLLVRMLDLRVLLLQLVEGLPGLSE